MILALPKTEKQKQKEQNHNEKPSSEMPLPILIIQIFLRLYIFWRFISFSACGICLGFGKKLFKIFLYTYRILGFSGPF